MLNSPPKSAPSVGSCQRIPPFPRIQRALITPKNLDQSICADTNSGVGGIDRMPKQAENNEVLARKLEATGDYKILRRLVRRQSKSATPSFDDKVGVIVDFEITGLDVARDEIIEAAMLKFS
jgi:hypothetical protein